MKTALYTTLLMAALPAAAQHETFAERPSKRQEMVQALRAKAQREKAEALQWAAARGIPVRTDNGRRTAELMAIRHGRPVYNVTENANAAISTAADAVRDTAPYQVSGAGVSVGVWDAGSVYAAHQEFESRVTLRDAGADDHYHATHVAGTIAAAGFSSTAKGMAPDAGIDSYDWSQDEAEMADIAAALPDDSGKLYLSNHSYGSYAGWDHGSHSGNEGWHFWGDWSLGADPYFGQYDTGARDWDQIVQNAPYFLPFKSAGNDRNDGPPSNGETVYYNGSGWQTATYNAATHAPGDGEYKGGYDTIPTKGNAKNIMTVGAVYDAVSGSSRSLSAAGIISFSGWGPADDGRIKPDIVANGYQLRSCDNDFASDYTSLSGTSMSSPNACGSAALLVNYYRALFPGENMRASTLKGLIIHTADDLGNPGPDYAYGWGLMNTLAAAELLRAYADNPIRLTEDTVTVARKSDTYTIFSNGAQPIRVTLCWTDPAGAATGDHDNRSPDLENDLDLRVEGPGGINYWPYKLDYSNPSADATADSKNNVDNVEQVYIALPAAGQYTITVDYDGSLSGNTQWYSLLISGPASDADGDGMPDDWETTYFLSPTGAVAEVDTDGDGADNLTEYISGFNPQDPDSVFEVTSFNAPEDGNAPFILNWIPVAGRLYSISHAENPVFPGFDVIPGAENIPHTQNSYTDTVERLGPVHLYRVNVRLDL